MGNIEKTFSLLSLGHRGVGKTVFLAASYMELKKGGSKARALKGWFGFDFDDERSRRNIGTLLAAIERTGIYPPPTATVSDFTLRLSLKLSPISPGMLCRFRWQDVPGELCAQKNHQFRSMVMAAHGCCLFIDAPALVEGADNHGVYTDIVDQAMSIAVLAANNRLVMPFAVVLTKCDALARQAGVELRLQERLDTLVGPLVALVPSCRIQCCQAPIEPLGDLYQLRPNGCTEALMWLMQQTWQAQMGAWPLQWVGILRALITQGSREADSLSPGTIERLVGGLEVPHNETAKRSSLRRNSQ